MKEVERLNREKLFKEQDFERERQFLSDKLAAAEKEINDNKTKVKTLGKNLNVLKLAGTPKTDRPEKK